jgi:glycosyltransferase involved in cell wall biosynthesis
MVGPFGFHPNKTMRSRALRLARPLVERGHDVKIFMPPWQTPAEAGWEWEDGGVALRYIHLDGGYLGITSRLIRETLGWKPDIVHAFKPKAYSGLTSWWLWTFRRRRIKLVTDTDDWEGAGGWNDIADYTPLQKRFFAWQERWGLSHCHALTVASLELQNLAWAHGLPKEKVFYLPNGPGIAADVDGESSKRAELDLMDRPVILLYSRLFEFDTERLVSILARVVAARPDVAVLTVGMSLFESNAAVFQKALTSANLTDAVFDVGWVDEKELPGYLTAADVGIYLMDDTLLNRTKCPVKLADMLSLGIPVVAEAIGQVPEYVVHEESGLLRQSDDPAGIASDLLELLQDQEKRERLADGAREHIQRHFSWERLADIAEGAYEFSLDL